MKRIALVLVFLAGCAAASGYDPKRYASADAGPTDPDTIALPPAPNGTIADPKQPPLPPPPPPPPPVVTAEPVVDAGPPDAGPKPRTKRH